MIEQEHSCDSATFWILDLWKLTLSPHDVVSRVLICQYVPHSDKYLRQEHKELAVHPSACECKANNKVIKSAVVLDSKDVPQWYQESECHASKNDESIDLLGVFEVTESNLSCLHGQQHYYDHEKSIVWERKGKPNA